MNPARKWSGRAVTEARAVMAQTLPAPCGQGPRCILGRAVEPNDYWVIGHVKSRAEHPELTWEVSNWRVEHRACSNASAQGVVIANARASALRDAGVFPTETTHGQPPPLPFSPPDPPSQPALSGLVLPFPTGKPMTTRDDLAWSSDRVRAVPWLAEFADVPADAAPPLYMSPPPDDATGSYGPECVEWIETEQKIRLRWWQRLAITRQLEHREDGTLCARVFIESAPRRAGKSVRMRGTALWRMHRSDLFGETQLVMHTGSDMAICREIQRQAWRWAEARWGKDAVTRANGKEAIETPEGDRWLVRSQDGVYGYDVTYGLVDEAWNVKPETVTEGMEPATLERAMPQLHLTSTAHRRATSLMRGRIATAMAVNDPEVVLLVWAAPPGSDPADPAVWKAASPHWSEDRHKLIAAKYEAALAGQADPQADDPDPMAGFTSQYLNVWRLNERPQQKGEPVTDADTWETLTSPRPEGPPAAAAIESWFSSGVSVALAWPAAGGKVVVSVTDHPTVDAAAAHVRACGVRRRVTVGASLLDHPAMRGLSTRKGEGRAAASVTQMLDLLREGVIRHDGSPHLAAQVTTVRVTPGSDGPRLVGSGRADAIKATVWAATAARGAATVGGVRILRPSAG